MLINILGYEWIKFPFESWNVATNPRSWKSSSILCSSQRAVFAIYCSTNSLKMKVPWQESHDTCSTWCNCHLFGICVFVGRIPESQFHDGFVKMSLWNTRSQFQFKLWVKTTWQSAQNEKKELPFLVGVTMECKHIAKLLGKTPTLYEAVWTFDTCLTPNDLVKHFMPVLINHVSLFLCFLPFSLAVIHPWPAGETSSRVHKSSTGTLLDLSLTECKRVSPQYTWWPG